MDYACNDTTAHQRMRKQECPTVLEIDYSFNEVNQQIDTIQLVDGGKLQVYSMPDIVAKNPRDHSTKDTKQTKKTGRL